MSLRVAVQMDRHIPDDNVVSNYTESIHGEALFKKGLIAAPSCVSCHPAHHILPADDKRSTIAREAIANTCSKCYHYQIAVALATALPHLSERSDICVISSLYRISDQLLQLVLNIQYSPSEVYTYGNRAIF